jgi:hypothetical protein
MIGEHKNCASAHTVEKMPTQCAALAVEPPTICSINIGSTGMTIPNASTSSNTTTKMKMKLAWRNGVNVSTRWR